MNNFFNQIQISKLFQPDYIFAAAPSGQGLYLYFAYIFYLLLILVVVLALINNWFNKHQKEISKKLIALFLTTSLIGLMLIFFRFEQIPYLSSRLIFCLLVLMFIIWGGYILYYRLVAMPKKLKIIKKREEFEKYIPKKGNKK